MERFLLQRADGCYFKHPTDEDLSEWTTSVELAHRWVDYTAASAAAYVWIHLKNEEVAVVSLIVFPNGYEVRGRCPRPTLTGNRRDL